MCEQQCDFHTNNKHTNTFVARKQQTTRPSGSSNGCHHATSYNNSATFATVCWPTPPKLMTATSRFCICNTSPLLSVCLCVYVWVCGCLFQGRGRAVCCGVCVCCCRQIGSQQSKFAGKQTKQASKQINRNSYNK